MTTANEGRSPPLWVFFFFFFTTPGVTRVGGETKRVEEGAGGKQEGFLFGSDSSRQGRGGGRGGRGGLLLLGGPADGSGVVR